VFARHQESCNVTAGGDPKSCNCTPAYYGVVWDRASRKHVKTRRFRGVMEARNARRDLADALAKGTPVTVAGPRLEDARLDFIAAAREGVALNKWGRRYRRRAWEDLDSSLRRLPDSLARRRLGDITRGDVQGVVDDMTRSGASGSRVRSVVNALRSLYRWAQDRDLVGHDPAANVRLPAMEATPRDRVATPAEFAQLLATLSLEDALPWALAGYGTARKQEIRILDWSHVDLKLGAVELAADEEGASRAVPGVSFRWSSRCARCCARPGSLRAGRARARSARLGDAASRACCSLARSRVASAPSGARADCSRSGCTNHGTPRPPGSTTPACRRRSPRR
jgi:hypothetical protein